MQHTSLPPFHLAIEVRELEASRAFYGELLGCAEGRSADTWVDFNFFGHQLVCHVSNSYPATRSDYAANPVDGHTVPVPHFGVVLALKPWQALANKLEQAGIEFVIAPHTRFRGLPGEQGTMFFLDPSGNPLEFKGFKEVHSQLFET